MDAKLALSLASSIDPKALASLRDRNHDPAVAKAVAAQFGSFLMQGMLQDSDGSALAMADGTGGPAVNAMFTSAMSRYAMSGDKLGLADMIYRSTAGQSQAPAAAPSTKSNRAGGARHFADALSTRQRASAVRPAARPHDAARHPIGNAASGRLARGSRRGAGARGQAGAILVGGL